MIFKTDKRKILLATLPLILLGVVIFAFTAGNYHISASKLLASLLAKFYGSLPDTITKTDEVILWSIRAPRVLMAIFVGFALSVAGTAYQGCFRNPLVEPFILGASAGAAFGAALGIIFPKFFLAIQVSAFIFSLTAVALSYFLAKRKGETPTVGLILSGVIVGSIFGSFVSILKYVSEDTQLREITFWMMGGLYYSNWSDVAVNAVVVSICLIIIWILGWKLNILSMGDEEARSLGVNPEKYKLIFIITATLATSVCVSSVGIIAWIGLMMPHAARLITGPDNRYVIPVSAIMGAIYLVICDTLSRTLTQSEIPLGIISSIMGAPFLIWLLRNKK